MSIKEHYLIENGVVYTPADVIDDGAIVFNEGGIVAVGTRRDLKDWTPTIRETFDAGGDLICPGFIDRHLHGGGGADTMDKTFSALDTMSRTHARFGVTAFCPATMAAPDNDIELALAAVADAIERGTSGARILGAHVEGPCMNVGARGAHFEQYVKETPPTAERVESYMKAARGHISLWTMAPELTGALQAIRVARAGGIRVSIGHTKATYLQVNEAIAAGAASATHLFNAMSGFHYRDAGGVMAILTSRAPFMAELILDGDHVHPSAAYVAIHAMSSDRIILITDCMRPVGDPTMSVFELPGLEVRVEGGKALTIDGKLCGSLLTMNRAVKHANEMLGIPLSEALKLATLNPAKSLGIEDRKGTLTVGKDADIVICDTFLNVKQTIVQGRTVFKA